MKDDRRNYVLVGAFVVAMVVGLILWLALLSGRTGATDSYHIRFNNILGLSAGAKVYFNGHPIGKIKTIVSPDDRDAQMFRLDVTVVEGWRIPDDSEAQITASSLLAAVVINIEGGDSETFLAPGSRILSQEPANLMAVVTGVAADVSNTLEKLTPEIESIVSNMNHTVDQVNVLLSPQNTGRIAKILENLEQVSSEIDGMTSGLTVTRKRLDELLVNAGNLISENKDEFSQSIVDLHESLEAMARHADAIAHNLEATTRNMNEFSQQIRENPGVLIRGRSSEGDPSGSN